MNEKRLRYPDSQAVAYDRFKRNIPRFYHTYDTYARDILNPTRDCLKFGRILKKYENIFLSKITGSPTNPANTRR